jgi:hypothetical protein
MIDQYNAVDYLIGLCTTVVTQEILDKKNFPNPANCTYLTPAFAVALSTGLGAAIVTNRVRRALDHKKDFSQLDRKDYISR